MSPRLRPPNTIRKRLCYYSSTATNEYFVDDSFDVIFLGDYKQHPFYAVLRSGVCKSLTLTTLYDQFIRQDGLQIFK